MYYIEKADKLNFIERILQIIKIKDDTIILPIYDINLSEKQSIKLAKKTDKILKNTISNKIVLSKELQENPIYVNLLNSYGYNIVDGRWLFEAIAIKILDYIIEKKYIKKEETSISILVNNLTDYALENIKILADEYKSLNIVTNHVEKFKNIVKNVYENQGLIITVTNNKKKSLSKSKIILNIDFPKELINKYNVYEDAVIISLIGNTRIDKKRFNGMIINDYEIITNNMKNNEKYYQRELYEAKLYKNIPYKELQDIIRKDKLEISELYGINGKIL